MNHDNAADILKGIESSKLNELKTSLIEAAVRYARLRTDWALADKKTRLEMDAARTRAHDAFIDACNILSRNMAETGEPNDWRGALGTDRKMIGDFACRLHAILGVRAR